MAEILEQSGASAKVRVEVPAEQVEKTTRELLDAYRRRLKVPGFRPGKAPDKVILARVGEEAFWDEVRERLIEASYPEAVRELGLAAIAARLVEGREAPLAGAPYAYTVEVELYPEVELPDWKSFELGVEKPEVTDAMVDEALEDLRRRYAEVQTVEREVQEGDHVVVEVDDGSRFPIELDRAEPHVREALLGKKAGDSFEIPVMSEEGEVVRQVPTRLIEVKEVRLPELDEEFAKTLEAENLDDLRAKVQRSLEAAAERDYLEARKQALLEKLAEALEVEIPSSMIRDEERAVLRDVEEDLQRQGIPLADYLKGLEREGKLEEFQADLRKQAEMRVRRGLALEKLSEDLGTQVTDEEWDAYLKSYAERYGLKPPEFKQAVGEEALENLKLRLLRDKALTEAAAQLA
ncbi:trigger factor [Oceanithermus profundus]